MMPPNTGLARLALLLALTTVSAVPGIARAGAPAAPAPASAPAHPHAAAKQAPAPQKVAVMAVRTSGIAKGVGSTLTEILTSEVATVSHLQVIGSSDIKSLLGFQAQKQLMGCTDDSACLAQIGGALGVDLLVSAQVGKIGKTYVVSVKLLRIDQAKVEGRTYETVKGALDDVIGRLKAAVRTVFTQAGYVKPGAMAKGHAPGAATAAGGAPAAPETPGVPWHVSGWSWGLWAGGLALLAGGGLMGLQARSSYAYLYPGGKVGPGGAPTTSSDGTQQEAAAGAQNQVLANVGFVAGGLAVAAGTALLFLDHGGAAPRATVAPVAAAGTYGAVATVRF